MSISLLYSSCTAVVQPSRYSHTTPLQQTRNGCTTVLQQSYNSHTTVVQQLYDSSFWLVLLPGDGEAGVPFIPRPKSCSTERHGRGNFKQRLETIRGCRWVGIVLPEHAASEMEPGEVRRLQENSLKLEETPCEDGSEVGNELAHEVEYETTYEGIYQDGCEPDYGALMMAQPCLNAASKMPPPWFNAAFVMPQWCLRHALMMVRSCFRHALMMV